MLQFLNTRGDPENRHHIVRMRDFFMFRGHLCLVFELLSVNLYELVKHNQFRGLSMTLLRVFTSQVLLPAEVQGSRWLLRGLLLWALPIAANPLVPHVCSYQIQPSAKLFSRCCREAGPCHHRSVQSSVRPDITQG